MRKTTKTHFEVFKKECLKWRDILGLKMWEIHFFHKESDGRADFLIDYDGMMVSITLAEEWDDTELSVAKIKKTAFHEMFEIAIDGLVRLLCRSGEYSNCVIVEETHKIVRLGENVLFPKY